MKTYSRAILSIALVALLAPLAQPAGAQSDNKPNIGAVEIVVKDIASKQDIATVQPGGTVTLPEGARVRLIMTALPRASAQREFYPATEYSDLTKGGVRITRSNEENAAADLEVLNLRNPNRTQNIRYQINETWVPAELRTGTFSILVAPVTADAGQVVQPWTGNQAEDLTRLLYRGILLREPDPGAQGTIDAIQRGGYEALVKAAVGIANSDESRVRIYEQPGLTNEKRLAALYENLLGLEVSQVDREQWQADLRRINIGEIAAVVETLLRSERFNSRYAVIR